MSDTPVSFALSGEDGEVDEAFLEVARGIVGGPSHRPEPSEDGTADPVPDEDGDSGGDGVRTSSAPPEQSDPELADTPDVAAVEAPDEGLVAREPEPAGDAEPERFDPSTEADLNRWWEVTFPENPRPSVEQLSGMMDFVDWAGGLDGDAAAVMNGWASGQVDVPALLSELVARRQGKWQEAAAPAPEEPFADDDDPYAREIRELRSEMERMRADTERREAAARQHAAQTAQVRAVDRFWSEHREVLSAEETQALQRTVYKRRLADSLLPEFGGDFEDAYHAALEQALWADPKLRSRLTAPPPTTEDVVRVQRASALSGSGISPVSQPAGGQQRKPANLAEARVLMAQELDRLREASEPPR